MDSIVNPLEAFDVVRHARRQAEQGGATPSAAGVLAAGQLLCRYRLVNLLGRGSFGEVWKAERKDHVPRTVALKLLPISPAGLPQEALAEALREAALISPIEHDHVCRIYDAGQLPEMPYAFIEMELAECTLDQYLQGHSLLPREAAGIVEEVCRGVAAVHAEAEGVVHRDIKPSNILRMPNGRHKIADFGLARPGLAPVSATAVGAEATATFLCDNDREICGTIAFMSPEQAAGEPPRRSMDVYSLGATLYFLLAGRPPHSGDTPDCLKLIRDPDHLVPRLPKQVPFRLAQVCYRAMAKRRGQRYSSVDALADDLANWRSHRPLSFERRPFWFRAALACRRNLGVTATAGAAVATLVAVTVLYINSLSFRRRAAEWQAYVASIGQAQASLTAGDYPAAGRALLRCPTRLRGWEWQHLHDSFGASAELLASDAIGLVSASASVDGSTVAWGNANGNVTVRRNGRTRVVPGAPVVATAVSGTGTRLAIARLYPDFSGRSIELVDLDTQNPPVVLSSEGRESALPANLPSYDAALERIVARLAFARDDALLLFASLGQAIEVWDVEKRSQVRLSPCALPATLAVSPDSYYAAWQSVPGIEVWHLGTLSSQSNPLATMPGGPSDTAVALAFGPKDSLIASYYSGALRVWQLAGQRPVLAKDLRAKPFDDLAFNSKHGLLAATRRASIELWPWADAGLADQSSYSLNGHLNWVSAVAMGHDSDQLISATVDGELRAWRLGPIPELTVRYGPSVSEAPHCDPLTRLNIKFGESGQLLYVMDVRHHKRASWRPFAVYTVAPLAEVSFAAARSLGYSGPASVPPCDEPSTNTARSEDGFVALTSGQRVWVYVPDRQEWCELPAASGAACMLSIDPKNRIVVVADETGFVELWEVPIASAPKRRTRKRLHLGPIDAIQCDHAGTRIYTVSVDHTLGIWRASDLERVQVVRVFGIAQGLTGSGMSLAVSPDDRHLALGTGLGFISMHDAGSGDHLFSVKLHSQPIVGVAFSTDGSRLATASYDMNAKLLETSEGREVFCLHHPEPVTSVDFSPNGATLATGCADGRIRFWSLRR